MEHFCEVYIEKVDVQPCLEEARCYSYRVHDTFCIIPVYPIGNVQSPIHAQRGQVVSRDCFRLSGALQQEKLRKNRHCLQEDGETPQNLCWCKLVVEQAAQDKAWTEKVFNAERVDGGVMCWSVTVAHEIENVTTAGDEEQLHGGIVYGDVAKEEIRIARHKDRYIESLRFERYTST